VSKIVDLGMRVYQLDAGQTSWLELGHSFTACGAGLLALVLAAVMAANVMLVLCGAWVTAYAGAIVVGLASRWTVELPMAYLRSALAYGLRAMTLQFIMGLGLDFLDGIIKQSSSNLADIGMTALALLILTILAAVLPWQVSHLAGGGGFLGGAINMTAIWTASQVAARVASEVSSGGRSGEGAASAVREALQAGRGGVMSVEEAAAHAERLQAQGIRPNRNGNHE
jgi:type IV secretory pathway TrbL component